MNKKGVSPVIATLLLIIIAVAAAILTYLWITGYMGTLQAQSSTAQTQEKIKIEAVKASTSAVTVYIRNVGDVVAKLDAIYVINAKTGGVSTVLSNIGQEITPGSVYSKSLSGLSLSNGKSYIIKAVTETGVEVTYEFVFRK